jgi:hypothetical protein
MRDTQREDAEAMGLDARPPAARAFRTARALPASAASPRRIAARTLPPPTFGMAPYNPAGVGYAAGRSRGPSATVPPSRCAHIARSGTRSNTGECWPPPGGRSDTRGSAAPPGPRPARDSGPPAYATAGGKSAPTSRRPRSWQALARDRPPLRKAQPAPRGMWYEMRWS